MTETDKIPVKDLIENMEAYGEGMQKGRELAIQKYDKILIELWDKMNDIEKKVDKLSEELKSRLNEYFNTRQNKLERVTLNHVNKQALSGSGESRKAICKCGHEIEIGELPQFLHSSKFKGLPVFRLLCWSCNCQEPEEAKGQVAE